MSMNFQIRHRSFLIIGIAEAQQSTFAIRTTLDLKKWGGKNSVKLILKSINYIMTRFNAVLFHSSI